MEHFDIPINSIMNNDHSHTTYLMYKSTQTLNHIMHTTSHVRIGMHQINVGLTTILYVASVVNTIVVIVVAYLTKSFPCTYRLVTINNKHMTTNLMLIVEIQDLLKDP